MFSASKGGNEASYRTEVWRIVFFLGVVWWDICRVNGYGDKVGCRRKRTVQEALLGQEEKRTEI